MTSLTKLSQSLDLTLAKSERNKAGTTDKTLFFGDAGTSPGLNVNAQHEAKTDGNHTVSGSDKCLLCVRRLVVSGSIGKLSDFNLALFSRLIILSCDDKPDA